MRAVIIQRGDRVTIVAPYVEAFVREVKDIPFRNRKWEADLQAWTVREPYVDAVVTAAVQHFDRVEFVHPSDSHA